MRGLADDLNSYTGWIEWGSPLVLADAFIEHGYPVLARDIAKLTKAARRYGTLDNYVKEHAKNRPLTRAKLKSIRTRINDAIHEIAEGKPEVSWHLSLGSRRNRRTNEEEEVLYATPVMVIRRGPGDRVTVRTLNTNEIWPNNDPTQVLDYLPKKGDKDLYPHHNAAIVLAPGAARFIRR